MIVIHLDFISTPMDDEKKLYASAFNRQKKNPIFWVLTLHSDVQRKLCSPNLLITGSVSLLKSHLQSSRKKKNPQNFSSIEYALSHQLSLSQSHGLVLIKAVLYSLPPLFLPQIGNEHITAGEGCVICVYVFLMKLSSSLSLLEAVTQCLKKSPYYLPLH